MESNIAAGWGGGGEGMGEGRGGGGECQTSYVEIALHNRATNGSICPFAKFSQLAIAFAITIVCAISALFTHTRPFIPTAISKGVLRPSALSTSDPRSNLRNNGKSSNNTHTQLIKIF